MLKTINGIRLVPFEPQAHTAQLYAWYYSGDYPDFYRDYPTCPTMTEIATGAQGKTFMIVRCNDNAILGQIMHFRQNEIARHFDVAVLIDKVFQGQGHGVSAFKILLNWKFNFCNLYKAKTGVMASNKRLCGILEKLGAFREGGPSAVVRKEAFVNGTFHDIAAYAMFKTDFNKKYAQEFGTEGTRLESPILKVVDNGQGFTRAIEAIPGPTVRVAATAAE